jgi:hypothetical protein
MKHQSDILRKLDKILLLKLRQLCLMKLKILLSPIIYTVQGNKIYFLIKMSSLNLFYKILISLVTNKLKIYGELVSIN